jgi:SPP1 gp7 family putative phage head morphogenesis protein
VRILGSLRGDLRSAFSYAEIGRALASGNLSESLLAEWRQDYAAFVQNKLRPEWDRQINAAGKATAGDISRFADQPFQFQPTGARVVEWVETRGAERVVSWTQLQHEAAQSIIKQAINEGVGADELGIRLRAVTGLTPRQAEAVEKMRGALIADGMDKDAAARQCQKYANMLHRQRALRIARTELASAYNQGQDAAIRQAIGDGMFDGPVTRFWSTSEDERVCDICGPLDGTVIGMDGQFDVSGGIDVPPAHVSCRCVCGYSVS